MRLLGVKTIDRQGDASDFVTFRLSEVNYISTAKLKKRSIPVPIYHTRDGSYAPLLTLKDLSMALSSRGFRYADRSTIINIKRVRRQTIDETDKIFTFIDGTRIKVSLNSKHEP